MAADSIFPTGKRLKLGIWGLGRGKSFIALAKALDIDVVGEESRVMHTETFVSGINDWLLKNADLNCNR